LVEGSHWFEKVVLHPARPKPIRKPPTPAKSSATFPTGLVGSLKLLDLYATCCLQAEAYEEGLTSCGIDAPGLAGLVVALVGYSK
jgi:hypothetical protein